MFFNTDFPNGGRGPEWVPHTLDFSGHFLQVAQPTLAAGRSVIVTGDVNTAYAEINSARPQANARPSGCPPAARAALGECDAAGRIDTCRHPHPAAGKYTGWDPGPRARERHAGWRLASFFVSPGLRDRSVSPAVGDDGRGSDHCPSRLTLDGSPLGSGPGWS